MGINLGGGFNPMQGQQMQQPQMGGILNMQKNDIIDLTKREPGLTKVLLGAGWDVSNGGSSFDLDISALLLNANGKLQNGGSDVIFFNNKVGQGIQLGGDNRTGAGAGDDEEIRINLTQIRSDVAKIVFIIDIHEAMQKRQTFGMVNHSYIRLTNEENGTELCRFILKEDASTATTMIFAELVKIGTDWNFKAIGEGKIADLNNVLSIFI
ncbi:TerD family protein [uncultured Clostridium sp.]|uniref:TerD family protein n=1 Tax=uncultured Clostridium sp. TaxID=59620 RepID=UPI002625E26E|nr:TerD family protein [uncultured Clostridium sp.]